jgi:hypothetical protein
MSVTEEQLATAIVAKMAGITLMDVDKNTVTQSSTGPATKIDPKQFLPGVQQMQQDRQAAALAQLNREAEMMHPLPQAQYQHPQLHQPMPTANVQTVSTPQTQTLTGHDPNQLTFDFLDEATTKKSLKQLDLIVDYLYSINNKLDKVLSKRD